MQELPNSKQKNIKYDDNMGTLCNVTDSTNLCKPGSLHNRNA